eukprot:m.6927 g.6927  ORF g.6927 m.6927 type:complete len:299 (-) comp5206_c0_seq1:256-1152(-)
MEEHPEHDGQSALKQTLKDFVAGSAAGFACKMVEFPFDTVKVLLQLDPTRYSKGAIACFKSVVRQRGFFSLYSGLPSPLLGSMAENSVLFSSFGGASRFLSANTSISEGTYQHLFGGAFAGLCVAHVLTPVELIKCKMQAQNVEGAARVYNSSFDCLIKVVKEDGIVRGLFRGHTATLLREIPGNMAWYTTYHTLKKQFTPEGGTDEDIPLMMNALAGGLSGAMYWTAFYPADTVKSLQQGTQKYANSSFITIFRDVLKNDGFKALYRGWGLTVTRAIPSNAVLFATYELVTRMLKDV